MSVDHDIITEEEIAAELAKVPGGGERPLTPDERDAYFADAGWEIATDADYEDDEPATIVVAPGPAPS